MFRNNYLMLRLRKKHFADFNRSLLLSFTFISSADGIAKSLIEANNKKKVVWRWKVPYIDEETFSKSDENVQKIF